MLSRALPRLCARSSSLSLHIGSIRTFAAKAAVVDNPYTGDTYCTVPYISNQSADSLVLESAKTQRSWRSTTLDQRIELCNKFMKEFEKQADQVAKDISGMMGKPLQQARNEVKGMMERARGLIDQAPAALADEMLPPKQGFVRKLAREPVGVVVVVAPWNYPLLTATNAIIPAVLAGNSVVIKHSSRSPLCADHFANAFAKAGAPKGLVQALHADHATVARVLARPEVGFAHFTGSVKGGHEVYSEVAKTRFIDVGLELGGKDPAYVAEDADLKYAVENVVDGGFYNAGQSCCGVERVYVHKSLYKQFLEQAVPLVQAYVLGNPLDAATNLGPMAQQSAVEFLTKQVAQAKQLGGKVLTGGSATRDKAGKGRFFAPTLVADATHKMDLMMEENFGPVFGVMSVANDEEAVKLMNDSPYGLTASIWTRSQDRAAKLAPQIETGTVFMNRCDYLDPYLAWTGVKDTGKGVTLSKHGFDAVTRLKSYHFRVQT